MAEEEKQEDQKDYEYDLDEDFESDAGETNVAEINMDTMSPSSAPRKRLLGARASMASPMHANKKRNGRDKTKTVVREYTDRLVAANGSKVVTSVEARIASARHKERKEQLNNARCLQREIKTLKEENRVLSRQVGRQNVELERLTGVQGQLPTILGAHHQEVRALKEHLRRVQEQLRETSGKLSQREALLNSMREESEKWKRRSRNLESREQLESHLDEIRGHLQARDEEVKELRHRMSVVEKSLKQKVAFERQKAIEKSKQLQLAQEEIESIRERLKEKERQLARQNIFARRLPPPSGRGNNSKLSSAMSLMSLSSATRKDEQTLDTSKDSYTDNNNCTCSNYGNQNNHHNGEAEHGSVQKAKNTPRTNDDSVATEKSDDTAMTTQNMAVNDVTAPSFQEVRQFFQQQQQKKITDSRHKSRPSNGGVDGVWTPTNVISPTKTHSHSSSSSTATAPSTHEPSLSTCNDNKEKSPVLDEDKKRRLLSQLNAIDTTSNSPVVAKVDVYGEKSEEYTPSFGSVMRKGQEAKTSKQSLMQQLFGNDL